MKRYSLSLLGLVLLAACGQKKETKAAEETLEAKAARIHQEVITIDTHDDISVANFTDSINYTQRLNTQVNLPKMREGQLDVAWLIVYTGQGPLTREGYAAAEENAMAKFEAIKRLKTTYAHDQMVLATSSAQVRQATEEGKMVAMIGVENAYPMGEDLANFEKYHALGARYVSLSHNGHSQFSDSNTGEADGFLHDGLSELGKQAVVEMNRLGMMIDVSHPSKEAMRQMIALTKAPIIASHSSARALCDHSRNLDDEQLMWLKENGGVVQTVAFSSYVNTEKHNVRNQYMSALRKKLAEEKGLKWYERSELRALSAEEREAFMAYAYEINDAANEVAANDTQAPAGVTVADFVDHIDHMVDLIGINHVGISSDFDGGGGITGWSDASETQNVTLELVKRGYSEEDIAKLWGENLLRVLDEVEAVSANWTTN